MNFYRFYLEGVLIDPEPLGWHGLVDSVDRDKDYNGIFHINDVELEFYGEMYLTLKNLFETAINNRLTINIKENRMGTWYDYYTGHLFLTQAEFFPDIKICRCKILDNSFYSKVKNNQNIDFVVDAGRSKNDVEFTVASDRQVYFFDPCTAAYDGHPRHTVTVYEAFRAAIAFMTDDTVDFDSVYFGVGGEMEGLVITSGAKLSTTDPAIYAYGVPYIPKFTFAKLYSEIKKKRNIGMRVDNSGVRPKIWIENASEVYQTEEIDHFENVSGIKIKYDLSRTYSQLEIGSSEILIGAGCPGLAFPEEIDWLGCKTEKYSIAGEANIDQVLSIIGDWIVSSNIIQDCVVNGNTDYNDRIFLVMTEFSGGVWRAIQYNNFGHLTATPRYYNMPLMNDQVANSYLGAIPNAIANLYPVSDDTMRASRTASDYIELDDVTSTDVYTPVNYSDDTTAPNHDVNNRFDIATDRYTAILGGAYTFQVQNRFSITEVQSLSIANFISNHLVVIIRMIVKDSGGVTKDLTYENFTYHAYQLGSFTVTANFSVHLAATDYVYVEFEFRLAGTITAASFLRVYMHEGYIQCTAAITAGGVYQSYDHNEYPAFLYEFEYPITPERMNNIISNSHKAIRVDNGGDESWLMWIDHSKYNRKTGKLSFTGLSSRQLLEQ